MNTQRRTPHGRFEGTPYFNGGLFREIARFEIERGELETVVEFAEPLSASEPAEWPGYCQGERPPWRLGLYVPGT
jgi:hypothetical protein